MRPSVNPQHEVGSFRNTGESFGRIARSITIPAQPAGSPARTSANDSDFHSRGELEAIALRANQANAFGQAALSPAAYEHLDSVTLHRAARAHASHVMRQIIASAARRAVGYVRKVWAQIEQSRQTHATIRALSSLDSHTLRDLGFHRSEIPSIAAQIAAARKPHECAPTRAYAVQTLRGLS